MPSRPGPGHPAVAPAAALAALALVLLAVGPDAPGPRLPAPDPSAGLAPGTIVERGQALVDRRRSREALPYYRRLVELTHGRNAGMHFAYAMTLFNAAFEHESTGAVPRASLPTSDARVGAMGECLAHMEAAVALAADPKERARFETRLGVMLLAWGFPWEGRRRYLAANADDPAFAEAVRRSEALLEALRDPVHARDREDPLPR